MRTPRLLTLLLLCTAPLTAQKTWIVDERGGAGHDFKDLPPALAAAADGDSILVRPGWSYTATPISKGVRILGEGMPSFYFATLKVTALPAGRTFLLAGFDLLYTNLELENCAGAVHVERLTGSGARITVTGSHRVTAANLVLQGGGGPTLTVTDSTLVLTGSRITGQDAYVAKYSSAPSELGGVFTNARVRLGATTLLGGNAAQHLAASSGLKTNGGELRIAGDAQSRIDAGSGTSGLASIETQGGTIARDARVQIPKITGNATITSHDSTALIAVGAGPGRNVATTQIGRQGHVSVLMAAVPIAPVPTPYGELALDLGSLLTLDSAVLDVTGRRVRSFPVPDVAALHGHPVALQTIGGTLSPERLTLSPPAVIALH